MSCDPNSFALNKGQLLKKQLSSEFDMKNLGAAKKILGMEITRDRNSGLLFLSQQSYIKKVLQRFNMHDAKPVSTPIAPYFKLSALQCASTDEDVEYMSRVPYSSAVGSLMYAMVCSRPVLSHAMSLVSRYMANPGNEHWKAVQWIFRYLRGTADACLKFGRTDKGLVDMWILILLQIWIREGHSQVMCLPLVVVL